jgi:hypothetical protein
LRGFEDGGSGLRELLTIQLIYSVNYLRLLEFETRVDDREVGFQRCLEINKDLLRAEVEKDQRDREADEDGEEEPAKHRKRDDADSSHDYFFWYTTTLSSFR